MLAKAFRTAMRRHPAGILGGLLILVLPTTAMAGRFVNLTETAAFPRSEGEVVQAAAFSTCSGRPCRDDILEFQAGIEYGLLPRFQVGFALPSVAVSWSDESQSTRVGGTSFWGLYNFIDPEEKGWGLSGAILLAEDSGERMGEAALLAEKQLGPWVAVYNGVAGRAWARVPADGSADSMAHSLGASYQATGSLFLGLEGNLYLTRDDGWKNAGRYLGPNISLDTGRLWITASAQFTVGPGEIIPDQVIQAQVGLPF